VDAQLFALLARLCLGATCPFGWSFVFRLFEHAYKDIREGDRQARWRES
jgi:hypothetical protein